MEDMQGLCRGGEEGRLLGMEQQGVGERNGSLRLAVMSGVLLSIALHTLTPNKVTVFSIYLIEATAMAATW